MTIKINNDQLSAIIEEWAKCLEEMATLRTVIADIKEKAKSEGYDLKAIKQALDIYRTAIVDGTDVPKQAVKKRNEQLDIEQVYIDVLGLGVKIMSRNESTVDIKKVLYSENPRESIKRYVK